MRLAAGLARATGLARAARLDWLVPAGLILAALLLGLDALLPPPLVRLADLSVEVRAADGRPLRQFLAQDDTWRLPAAVEDVSPNYLALLLAFEDQRYYRHIGVDPLAAIRAIGQTIGAGRVISGASTLTMQVARLLDPAPRTLTAKLIETVRAFQLEARFDKNTILGFYLTLAPFGGNVAGIRAGAWALYGKAPEALTDSEAALLVALPQAPSRLRPDRAPELARAARDRVLARAVAAGALTAQAAAEAAEEPVPLTRRPPPSTAWHAAERLRRLAEGLPKARSEARTQDNTGAPRRVHRTTIDAGLQGAVEALAARTARDLLHPAAALALLVVDNRRRAVLAYVGGPDPLSTERHGAIDMVHAVRSPGSTLKPFLYALGFEDGVIHPETLVADVSTRFGGYAPANFHRTFAGELTVREALRESLNVPAVLVLNRIGPLRLATALRGAGARLVFPPGNPRPDLPLALGGVGITLWDLTTLYVGLARGGRVAPLRLDVETDERANAPLLHAHTAAEQAPKPPRDPDQPSASAGWPMVGPDSAAQVLAILAEAPPPPDAVPGQLTVRPPIAVKTGTSFGFRDAWAFGTSADHTVGVWVGRPDGTPSPERFGRNTAAPLVYHVFDLLPAPRAATAAPQEPAGPGAGQDPGGAADDGRTPPPLLRRLTAGTGDSELPPAEDPDRLRLIFPTDGADLALSQLDGSLAPLPLTAAAGRRPLTWLVNGRPLEDTSIRRTTRRDALWHPVRSGGPVRITVIDADGRSDHATVTIR